jgi:hypothetical protein
LASQIDSAAALFAAAKALSRDVEIDPVVLDYVYDHRTSSELSRADWEVAVRDATAVSVMLRAPPRDFPWSKLVKPEAIDRALRRLAKAPNASRGTLLVTFHGAFSKIGARLFSRRAAGGLILGVGQIRDDARSTLFAALNALRDGRMVLMAPDGGHGRQTAHVKVLGTRAAVSDGAAFLAHASGCNTAWYTIIRQGDRLVPVIVPGPAARDGETVAAFSERLHDFYAQQIETVFTGDPCNLSLLRRWVRCFAGAAREVS